MLICLITGDVNLDYLLKVKSAKFLHYKVIICVFVINKYFGSDNFEAMQISCFSSNFLPLILESIFLLYCSKDDSVFHSFYTYSLEFYKEQLFVSPTYLFNYLYQ